jgi:hypothetical protein
MLPKPEPMLGNMRLAFSILLARTLIRVTGGLLFFAALGQSPVFRDDASQANRFGRVSRGQQHHSKAFGATPAMLGTQDLHATTLGWVRWSMCRYVSKKHRGSRGSPATFLKFGGAPLPSR